MTLIQALILGIIQGLTEFLPISSSTHLTIAKKILYIEPSDWMVYFDLICHFGTLFAIFTMLWKEAWNVLKSIQSICLFALALLPLVPGYFLFKPLRILFSNDAGFFLILTSAMMFFASSRYCLSRKSICCAEIDTLCPKNLKDPSSLKWQDALWIGLSQSLALIPGISRSASTISTARILGWEWKNAARFSFLLSIPTIIGGSLFETMHASISLSEIPWKIFAIGFVSSFLMGIGSVRLLFWILNRGTLRPFAWYCLGVGLLLIFWLR